MSSLAASADHAQPVARVTRWKVLFGAILVQLILGTVYGYSIFWQPLEAAVYPTRILTAAQAAQLSAGRSELAGVVIVADEAAATARHEAQKGLLKYSFAICILSFAVLMVWAGRIQDQKGPRFTAFVGASLLGAGFVLAGAFLISPLSAAASETLKLAILWVTLGLMAGAGIGFAYVCPIAALIKWFPEHKGLVSGVAVAGFGLGAYIFSQKDAAIGAPPFIAAHGIGTFFLVHGIVSFLAVSVGASLLTNPPGGAVRGVQESTWRETLRRPAFYMLWLMFFSGALAGLTVIGILKDFAGEQLVAGAGPNLPEALRNDLLMRGAEAVGWLAVFNALGRVCWGLVSDRVGRTAAFITMFVIQAVVLFSLTRLHTELGLAVGASLVGFNFGGNFALFPSTTADLFGAKNLGANYGLVFTSYGIAGVVGVYSGNTAKALTHSYGAAFAVAACLCILSAVLAMALRATHKPAAAQAS
ncbi:MAG: OFA family MFS transporter [Chthonomonadales bacterium]